MGWSASSAKRNTNFLRSVDASRLPICGGYAMTLTVRECPQHPDEWKRLLRTWVERQRRQGMSLLHWVMEFQKRKVPHLHCAIWYQQIENKSAAAAGVFGWVDLANRFGTTIKGQYCRDINGAVGWFQYMAKHCSRSRIHYQRQRDSLPPAWSSCPGVWGHRGSWPTVQPSEVAISHATFYAFRRLVKRYRLSEVRQQLPDRSRQLAYLRRTLKSNDRNMSSVRPVSEWVDADIQQKLYEASQLAAAS